MSSARLPLFPLGTVLLPGARLPLRLFEARYLELARDLEGVAESERLIGVVWIRRGNEVGAGAAASLAEVGCVARVDAMARDSSTGRPTVHLVGTGTHRFHLDGIDEAAGTAYAMGEVTWLGEASDEGGPPIGEVVERALRSLAEYRKAVGAEPARIEAVPGQLAYRIAEQALLPFADQQEVLAAGSERARLHLLTRMLRRETGFVRQFRSLPHLETPGGAGLN